MDKSKTKLLVFLIMLIASGLGLTVAGFSDVKCLLSGRTIEVGNSEKKDYRGTAIAEGEVFFIQGPFATYEQTNTTFGIPSGKTKTYYYLALDMTRDDFVKAVEDGETDLLYNGFYFVYATADKKRIEEADKAAEICEAYAKRAISTFDYSDVPDVHLKISGKLMKEPSDSEYKKIRDEYFSTGDLKSTEVADLMVRDGKPGIVNVFVLAFGILLIVIPVVILIVLFVKKKKEESAAELW